MGVPQFPTEVPYPCPYRYPYPFPTPTPTPSQVMSINFRVPTLEACNRNVSRMESEIARLKASDASRLNDEYQRLPPPETYP